MPFIVVRMLEGRTIEQKRAMVEGITEVMERTCGAPPENTGIVIEEVSREDWARGGILVTDREAAAKK